MGDAKKSTKAAGSGLRARFPTGPVSGPERMNRSRWWHVLDVAGWKSKNGAAWTDTGRFYATGQNGAK